MEAVARRFDDDVVQQLGRVEELDPEIIVASPSGRVRAARAVSCIVAPEEGDTVLVAVAPSGRAWVLAVLERPEGGTQRWTADGDVRIGAGGALEIEGGQGVEVRTPRTLSLTARLLEAKTVDVRAFAERWGITGAVAQVDLKKMTSVIGFCDQVMERVSQTVKRSYRFVEELDVTRAREIDVQAEENATIRARNTLMSSDVLMKVDAEQIHLG